MIYKSFWNSLQPRCGESGDVVGGGCLIMMLMMMRGSVFSSGLRNDYSLCSFSLRWLNFCIYLSIDHGLHNYDLGRLMNFLDLARQRMTQSASRIKPHQIALVPLHCRPSHFQAVIIILLSLHAALYKLLRIPLEISVAKQTRINYTSPGKWATTSRFVFLWCGQADLLQLFEHSIATLYIYTASAQV